MGQDFPMLLLYMDATYFVFFFVVNIFGFQVRFICHDKAMRDLVHDGGVVILPSLTVLPFVLENLSEV